MSLISVVNFNETYVPSLQGELVLNSPHCHTVSLGSISMSSCWSFSQRHWHRHSPGDEEFPQIWELWWEKGLGRSKACANKCMTKHLKLFTSCSLLQWLGEWLSLPFLSLVSKKEQDLSLSPWWSYWEDEAGRVCRILGMETFIWMVLLINPTSISLNFDVKLWPTNIVCDCIKTSTRWAASPHFAVA